MGETAAPRYTQRYVEALAYAADLHATQMRKATPGTPPTVPYLAHLLEVSALVWTGGGDETQAIAGLLHDSLEDRYPIATADILAQRFGGEVRDIVLACTDGTPGAPRGSDGFLVRKARYVAHLYAADPRALVVTVADKISNAQAILADHAEVGDELWSRFNSPKQAIAWYYDAVLQGVRAQLPDHPLVRRLAPLSAQITEIAGSRDLRDAFPDEPGAWLDEQVESIAAAKVIFAARR